MPTSIDTNSSKYQRLVLAKCGEDEAANWLILNGFTIEERNWRCGRFAEIDIIARDCDGIIVFVEVKTRAIYNKCAGFANSGFESITWRKQKKITTAAMCYLSQTFRFDRPSRIDVIVVELATQAKSKSVKIHHIAGAF